MAQHFRLSSANERLSHNPKGMDAMTDWEKKLSYRMLADAQLMAWDESAGFFFWSYKLMSDPPAGISANAWKTAGCRR